MKPEWRFRYSNDSYWINWANELLELLSAEGIMPTLDVESGVVVENDHWIEKPSGFRSFIDLFDPENEAVKFRAREENGKLKLVDTAVEKEASPASITAFSNYATESVDVDITGKEENDFENYLLVITGGTRAGETFVLSGNDESGVSTTRLYFLHSLSSAFDGTEVTAGYITTPEYYLMLRYHSTYSEVTTIDDELPIDDKFERRLTQCFFSWKIYEEAMDATNSAREWERKFYDTLNRLKSELLRGSLSEIKPRNMTGLERLTF